MISSPKEFEFIDILAQAEFIESKDYFHQYCFHDDDIVIVVDFFFPHMGIVIELDDKGHQGRHKRAQDDIRDRMCRAQGYSVIRIKTPIPANKIAFWVRFLRCCRPDETAEE